MSLLLFLTFMVYSSAAYEIKWNTHKEPQRSKIAHLPTGKKDLFYYSSGMTSAKGISPDGIKMAFFAQDFS